MATRTLAMVAEIERFHGAEVGDESRVEEEKQNVAGTSRHRGTGLRLALMVTWPPAHALDWLFTTRELQVASARGAADGRARSSYGSILNLPGSRPRSREGTRSPSTRFGAPSRPCSPTPSCRLTSATRSSVISKARSPRSITSEGSTRGELWRQGSESYRPST